MRKDFGVKTWAYPMPVFIVAAYDKGGKPNCMNAAKRSAMHFLTERS